MSSFAEVAAGVHVLRYPVLDVNVTLVVGDGGALLVDTLSTQAQARELAAAVREVTPYPCTVVNTHHHFDHCFGNAVFAGEGDVWAHEDAATLLTDNAAALQRHWYEQWSATHPDLATGLAAAPVHPPRHTVRRRAVLHPGGRQVVLQHLGRGHTAGDLVVHIPDADVLVAGDLVEESGPPDFEDAYPLEWPETLAALRRLAGAATTVLPGHGAPVDHTFVAAQHDRLTALAWLIREGHGDGAPATAVADRAAAPGPVALPDGVALAAVRRGYAELSGQT